MQDELTDALNLAWDEITHGDYASAYGRILPLLDAPETPRFSALAGNCSTALIYARRWDRALEILRAAREHDLAVKRSLGGFDATIAACLWCCGDESQAIAVMREYVELLAKKRKRPRGVSLYSRDGGFLRDAGTLWYFAVSSQDTESLAAATELLQTSLGNNDVDFRAAFARFALGAFSLDQVAAHSMRGIKDLAALKAAAPNNVLAARNLLRIRFVEAVRDYGVTGDRSVFVDSMRGILSMRHFHVDDEYLFARYEVDKS